MNAAHKRTTEAVAPYGGSFGTWFLSYFAVGLGIAAVIAGMTVHLCNEKVARDGAARDAEWAASGQEP